MWTTGGKSTPKRLVHWTTAEPDMRTKDFIEEAIWESLMKKATPYKAKPNVGMVANDVIEVLAV